MVVYWYKWEQLFIVIVAKPDLIRKLSVLRVKVIQVGVLRCNSV